MKNPALPVFFMACPDFSVTKPGTNAGTLPLNGMDPLMGQVHSDIF